MHATGVRRNDGKGGVVGGKEGHDEVCRAPEKQTNFTPWPLSCGSHGMLEPHCAFSSEAQYFPIAVALGRILVGQYFRQQLESPGQRHGGDCECDAVVVAAAQRGLVAVVLVVLLLPQHRGRRWLGWKLVESRESFASVPARTRKGLGRGCSRRERWSLGWCC